MAVTRQATEFADVLLAMSMRRASLRRSFPVKVQDNPAYLNYRSQRGRTLYGEDIYIGYRYYEAMERDVLFPSPSGTPFHILLLKYRTSPSRLMQSTTSSRSPQTSPTSPAPQGPAGSEVVQVYIHRRNPSIGRPPKELKVFSKVSLEPGQSKIVEIVIELKRATSFWDETAKAWISEKRYI
ncbi:fibronectin type III-like domain-containing protein [Lipomyces doorenjongii]|uniref:fibronectin type III-like domain-containing protein n=1 Tax=Lipomyces doorenjongii TaxID=383834 RepID=UPI0034CD8742